jgi:hypothetical protein
MVLARAEGSITIHIQASKAVQGCNDGRATVKRIDDRHLEGAFPDGRPLKLQRR